MHMWPQLVIKLSRLPACDAGPASNQHRFNASCLLGCGSGSAYYWRRVQADTDLMSGKCWASVAGAGQHPFSPSQ